MSNEYRIRSMPIAAYAVACGCNFPTVVEEDRRNIFVFDDEDGSAQAAYQEFRADDPQGVGCQVNAPRLFEAWQLLKTALPPRPAR